MLIHADRMLHPDGALAEGWLAVQSERIVHSSHRAPADGGSPDRQVPLLVPGFVDLHCHGGGGASLTSTDPEQVTRAVDAHRRAGTTTMLASLVTDTLPALTRQVQTLRQLTDAGLIAGSHLEGPWLSRHFPGAHDPDLLTPPTAAAVDELLAAGGGSVRMVTLAPELEGALDAVRRLAADGVVAAVGHTDADAACARAAFAAGARVVTHLFNAMRPLHHRSPGLVPVALADDRVTVELIADGVHVHPDVLALAARAARGGFVLVTDAMAAALALDGDYELGAAKVSVEAGVARLAGTEQIAGSTLTMHEAVRRAVGAGIGLEAALLAATRTPAGILERPDIGMLTVGARADLVALDPALDLLDVMHQGSWLPAPRW